MLLRHKIRRKDGTEHRTWSVVETAGFRTGAVQRQVLYLGEINDSQRAVWGRAIEALDEGGCPIIKKKLKSFIDAVDSIELNSQPSHRPRRISACGAAGYGPLRTAARLGPLKDKERLRLHDGRGGPGHENLRHSAAARRRGHLDHRPAVQGHEAGGVDRHGAIVGEVRAGRKTQSRAQVAGSLMETGSKRRHGRICPRDRSGHHLDPGDRL